MKQKERFPTKDRTSSHWCVKQRSLQYKVAIDVMIVAFDHSVGKGGEGGKNE